MSNTTQFEYDKELNIFYGNEKGMWCDNDNYKFPFPNQCQQFFIHNKITRNFRRFGLVYQNEIEFVFKSEDKILCLINKFVS